MAPRKSGPKTPTDITLNLDGLAPDFPQRALDLVAMFGYRPYRWQRKIITAIYRDRSKCAALFYIQIAKKNGKTALAAMIALIELCLFDGRHIYAVSDSQTNLSSVFWLEFTSRINESGYADCFTIYQLKIENPATGSFIQMRPGNFAASQGINPHLVIVDEVHLMAREVWNGYLMAGDAREDSLVLGITTPGYNYDCAAYDLYNEAKTGSDPDLEATIYEPSNGECERTDEVAWKEANPAYDESPALRKALVRHARRMPESDFRRFRLGQWTNAKKTWMPYGAFKRLAVEEPIPDDAYTFLALDGSWNGDTTGLVACSFNPRRLEVIGHWKPPAMNDGSWRVPIAEVEAAIRKAAERFENLVEVVCDPARWSRTMQALFDEGLPIVEYPQSTQRMAPATLHLFEAVVDGTIEWFNGADSRALEVHISMAEVKETDQGAVIRKPAFAPAASNIDLAVCSIMANDRATRFVEPADLEVEWITIGSGE